MLWNETSLSSIAKIRILFYTYLIPLVIYMILLIYVFNAADRALQGVGGGF